MRVREGVGVSIEGKQNNGSHSLGSKTATAVTTPMQDDETLERDKCLYASPVDGVVSRET